MSTPGRETGREKTFGIAISSSNANDDTFGRYASRYAPTCSNRSLSRQIVRVPRKAALPPGRIRAGPDCRGSNQ